jgi:hypothetical protein
MSKTMNRAITQDISDTYKQVPNHSDAFERFSPENLDALPRIYWFETTKQCLIGVLGWLKRLAGVAKVPS